MNIERRIPRILRLFAFRRDVLFRVEGEKPSVYLTFDDGPIPESTPELLSILAEVDAKATFFVVADNVRKYPRLYQAIMEAGHSVGNHTYHHRPPFKESVESLMEDVELACKYVDSGLFRPPHGLMWPRQQKALSDAGYRVVMFDLNTRDYRTDITADDIVETVEKYVRPGCIINLHDSLKSIDKLRIALPRILNHLHGQGYSFDVLK